MTLLLRKTIMIPNTVLALTALGGVLFFANCADHESADVAEGSAALAADPSSDLDAIARTRIAQETGSAIGKLEIGTKSVVHYRHQKRSATHYKIVDRERGTVSEIALESDGKTVDGEALFAVEQTARRTQMGALDPSLAQALQNAPNNDPVPVTIWLKESAEAQRQSGPAPRSGVPTRQQQARILREVEDLQAQVHRRRLAALKPVLTKASARLKGLDANLVMAEAAPMVHARLRPSDLKSIAHWGEIAQISPAGNGGPAISDAARVSIGVDRARTAGYMGTGVKIAAIEVGAGISPEHPYLNHQLTRDPVADYCYLDPGNQSTQIGAHATYVADVMHSTRWDALGVAPDAQLWMGYSCTWNEDNLKARINSAVEWGARAVNLSLGNNVSGDVDTFARYCDDLVRNSGVTVVAAAGNSGISGRVESPAIAYNVIAVGCYDEANNNSCSTSSTVNPNSYNHDREKPDISAPGAHVVASLYQSPWEKVTDIGTGTSMAAPVVTGTAALMMQANANLGLWPESVKAILMATAIRSIDGATGLSDRAGAGGVNADAAVKVAGRIDNNRWGGEPYNCSAPDYKDDITANLTAGKRTRITIVWDNNTAYDAYGARPSADLDLSVLGPDGIPVIQSLSNDNTFELVDFTPAVTGQYTLRVSKFRCNADPGYLGWAVYQQ